MRRILIAGLALSLFLGALAIRRGEAQASFSPYVDVQGNIRIPEDYRDWAFLGTWHIAPEKGSGDAAGAIGFHNVYTQRSAVQAYRKTGRFPDGAVIVKELLKSKSGTLTTGEVSWGTQVEGWFVMVKDDKERFPNSPLWGNGWGWVLFNSNDPKNTVTRNWRLDCLGCHLPAGKTDWVFVQGYPTLMSESGLSTTARSRPLADHTR